MKGFTIDPMNPLASRQQFERTTWAGVEFRRGDRVRLRPRDGAGFVDVTLCGRAATITAIEQDFEDRVHVAVRMDEPGEDDEARITNPFFFGIDEVEPFADSVPRNASVATGD